MLRTTLKIALTIGLCGALLHGAEAYSGPRPPKTDLPFLMHADNLLPMDVGEAKEERRKDNLFAVIAGPAATAKTPLAEPIFLLRSEKIPAAKLALFRMEVKNGNREVLINSGNPGKLPKPLYLTVVRLDDGLYRIEADQPLEVGEYSLSPDGSNQTFSFQIY